MEKVILGQYPEYTPNFVDYSFQIIKIRVFIVLTYSWNSSRKKIIMDLCNKRKKYVKIDRETGSDKIFELLDEVNSHLEDGMVLTV